MSPVPRQIEVPGFEGVENRLDSIHIGVSLFLGNAVQSSLQCHSSHLFLVISQLARSGVTFEVSHVQFDVLRSELLLLRLELQELFTINRRARAPTTTTTSGASRQTDAHALGVNSYNTVQPSLGISFR